MTELVSRQELVLSLGVGGLTFVTAGDPIDSERRADDWLELNYGLESVD